MSVPLPTSPHDGCPTLTASRVALTKLHRSRLGSTTDRTSSIRWPTDLHAGTSPSFDRRRPSDAVVSPFLSAARCGSAVDVAKYLEIQKADEWSVVDPTTQQNALHVAVAHGHLHIAKRLCSHPFGPRWLASTDVYLNTPLHVAASTSRRLTQLLLDAGAGVNALNQACETPLSMHIASTAKDDPGLAERLLTHGADANAVLRGESLLHAAVDRGLLNIACRLVRFGGRLDTRDGHGRMVFDKVNAKASRKLFAYIPSPLPWVPDDARDHCMECSRRFSPLLARRHHCRHCGRLCCAACTSAFVLIEGSPLQHKPQRYYEADDEANVVRTTRASLVYNQLVDRSSSSLAAAR
ncbi:hypothetical protein SPRG_08475 [Saprolegnia parasitica CBS 223.65]|uniref:FYVE-type domain-containing protein n=1 Tax=Saprolegnia parasitica (strain CBS 223.65) TaxID=695850 RepID=A0A067C5S9_SAPPC|nr:hypothetical protein SPRG_08475 [Saprolegnia parasitica CBS 223.65]KDO26114.1 hypothetical protein SPRG_08475 [Saprolegnia parasitica CBS 223.65]|eukprot:XP_012203110.1 hypothetical protein SPRG_08475 [Saprolegnia parasitica CBS 223.65]